MKWLRSLKQKPVKLFDGFIIGVVVVITYYSGLGVGFWSDDYAFLEMAARLPLTDYLSWYFDPRLQSLWYRPIPGMLWWIEWHLFGGNALGYHAVYISIHVANCLLLYAITSNVTRKRLVGLVSAVVYAGINVYSHAVLRPSDETALATFFYLFTIHFWLAYLTNQKLELRVLAYSTFLLALFSKEATVTLPIVLFTLDCLVIRDNISIKSLIRKYIFFAVVLIPYLIFEVALAPKTVYSNSLGYGLGIHMFFTLGEYLTHLVFPWNLPTPLDYLWLILVIIILLFRIVLKRDFHWLFVVSSLLFICAPYIPFQFFFPRFLYLPMMLSVAGISSALVALNQWLRTKQLHPSIMAIGIAGIVTINGLQTMSEIAWLTRFARESRLPVRAIARKLPNLPDDTLLYFIAPPVPLYGGMFLLQYGPRVSVSGDIGASETIWRNITPKPVELRKHSTAYIIYFDEKGEPKEQMVEHDDHTTPSLLMPINFGPIQLSGYEVTSAHVEQGEAIVVLLYWQATNSLERDYTVFAHLTDNTGQILAGTDSRPRGGTAPTQYWQKDNLIIDWVIIPIDENVPAGNEYRLVIGWYYLPTMERLMIVDSAGNTIENSFEIKPFSITR